MARKTRHKAKQARTVATPSAFALSASKESLLFTVSDVETLAQAAERCEMVGEQMSETCEGLTGVVVGLQAETKVESDFAREQKEEF